MQVAETRDRLERNGIDLFIGSCNFVDEAKQFGLNYYDNDDIKKDTPQPK